MTKERLNQLLSDIDGYAKKFACEIIKEHKTPPDLPLSVNDAIHEVNLAFVNIAKTYKPKDGGVSLNTYCYNYGKRKALSNILRAYKRIKDKLATTPIEEEGKEILHQYVEYVCAQRKAEVEVLEEADLIENLRLMADETDRRIMDLLFEGHSRREIERIIGLSHQAISKRIRRLGMRFRRWEDKPLGG